VVELKKICNGLLDEDIDVRHIFAMLEKMKIDITMKERD
jgi:hypothetical protein